MNEALLLLENYVRMVWRYRWVALVGATLVCIVGWSVVLLLPNQYEVSAKVFLDSRSLLRPLLRGLAVDSNLSRDAALMMRRTLLVRPNLEAVARKTDLDLRAKAPEQFETLLTNLADNIEISGTRKDNIFVISYRDQDPRLAARIVETLLSIFVERSLGDSRKDTSTTRQFLERQIKEYERRLDDAETRLKQFKQKNVGLLPGEGQEYFSRLRTSAMRHAEASLQLREAQNRRDELSFQLEGVGALFELSVPPPRVKLPHPLDDRIRTLESSLDQLLLRYTEEHPDVKSTRTILADLKQTRNREQPKYASGGGGPQREQAENPIYQELKVSLGAAEAEVAALRARVTEYAAREKDLGKLVDTIPQVEAELKRLNRNYGNDKRNYDELVKRRESLNLSDEASQTTDDVKFNIIEPPRVPLVPAGPDRPKLNAGVLTFGIVGGIGLAWVLGMLRPAIYSKEQFAEITDLPILGAVTRFWTPAELIRSRIALASFAVGCLCLLGLFAGLVHLQSLEIDLVSKLTGVGQKFL